MTNSTCCAGSAPMALGGFAVAAHAAEQNSPRSWRLALAGVGRLFRRPSTDPRLSDRLLHDIGLKRTDVDFAQL